jgi:hypothetical protein
MHRRLFAALIGPGCAVTFTGDAVRGLVMRCLWWTGTDVVRFGGFVASQPPLTVHNAEIHTASVEIKTLTLKGRQVTLAVFRQLRESPLVAEDGTLNGVPWGVVNYHPDKCAGARAHWHVVWQRGVDLLRSAVEVDPDSAVFQPDEGDLFLASHVRDLLRGGGSEFFGGGLPSFEFDGKVLYQAGQEAAFPVALWMDLLPVERDFLRNRRGGVENPWDRQKRDAILGRLDRLLGGDSADPALTARLSGAYRAALAREEERRQQHREVRTLLAKLPQLFIAV